MNQYVLRATIAVPSAHIQDARQLALVLGESAVDIDTFRAASFQDAAGNAYAVASTVAKADFATRAQATLTAPDHAPNADITAATRAQALIAIEDRLADDAPIAATPDKIVSVFDHNSASAQEHISSMGLTRIPLPDELI
jgi:hypothetical protein